jgi:hypothetical protein
MAVFQIEFLGDDGAHAFHVFNGTLALRQHH